MSSHPAQPRQIPRCLYPELKVDLCKRRLAQFRPAHKRAFVSLRQVPGIRQRVVELSLAVVVAAGLTVDKMALDAQTSTKDTGIVSVWSAPLWPPSSNRSQEHLWTPPRRPAQHFVSNPCRGSHLALYNKTTLSLSKCPSTSGLGSARYPRWQCFNFDESFIPTIS